MSKEKGARGLGQPLPPVRAWAQVLLALLLAVLAVGGGLLHAPRAAADDPPDPPVTVEAHADKDVITIGDRIRLTVVVHALPGVTVEVPRDDEALGEFEVLERHPGTVQPTPDGGQILRLDYVITAFEPGSTIVPGIAIPFSEGQGARQMAYAPELPVVIRSVLENDPAPQLYDLKPPLGIPGGVSNTVRSVATTLLVAATLILAIMALRRLPRRARSEVRLSPLQPEVSARHELEAIVADGLVEREQYEAFYRRLALCIRRYLEGRYGLPALSCTSTELVREMERRRTDRWLARVVVGLLEECDTVRWAGYLPAEARARRALDLAFTIVEMEAKPPVGVAQT